MNKTQRARMTETTTRQRQIHRIKQVSSVTAAVLTALYGSHAVADTDAEDSMVLQEVTVTATRRAV
jgi:hypothetical protein